MTSYVMSRNYVQILSAYDYVTIINPTQIIIKDKIVFSFILPY